MENKHPLVSIIIVTYNSESTVVETLESAIGQSYDNIEIIISDDCSKDNTVKVVKVWIEQNSKEYKGHIELLVADSNQGVCKNFNKAIRSSSGEFIKIIAGDDKLLPTCCEDYVRYVKETSGANFVTSYVRVYNETFDEKNLIQTKRSKEEPTIFHENANVQLRKMAYQIFVSAPTMFFSRVLYDKVGGFDERYLYEDHPFYINVLEAGEKIYLLPKATVAYRIHDSTFNSNQKLFNYRFSRSSKQFREARCYKYYGIRQKLAVKAYYGLLTSFERLGWNKKTRLSFYLYRALTGLVWRFGRI